jgi:hypothetical protein
MSPISPFPFGLGFPKKTKDENMELDIEGQQARLRGTHRPSDG